MANIDQEINSSDSNDTYYEVEDNYVEVKKEFILQQRALFKIPKSYRDIRDEDPDIVNWLKVNYEYKFGSFCDKDEELYQPFFRRFAFDDISNARVQLGILLRKLFRDVRYKKRGLYQSKSGKKPIIRNLNKLK